MGESSVAQAVDRRLPRRSPHASVGLGLAAVGLAVAACGTANTVTPAAPEVNRLVAHTRADSAGLLVGVVLRHGVKIEGETDMRCATVASESDAPHTAAPTCSAANVAGTDGNRAAEIGFCYTPATGTAKGKPQLMQLPEASEPSQADSDDIQSLVQAFQAGPVSDPNVVVAGRPCVLSVPENTDFAQAVPIRTAVLVDR